MCHVVGVGVEREAEGMHGAGGEILDRLARLTGSVSSDRPNRIARFGSNPMKLKALTSQTLHKHAQVMAQFVLLSRYVTRGLGRSQKPGGKPISEGVRRHA